MYMSRLHVSWQLQTHFGVSMNYKISWTQNYSTWQVPSNSKSIEETQEQIVEAFVEASEFREAISLIDYIKSL